MSYSINEEEKEDQLSFKKKNRQSNGNIQVLIHCLDLIDYMKQSIIDEDLGDNI